MRVLLTLVVLSIVIAGCSTDEPEADELVLYAAASTQPIVDELARAFEIEHGFRVTCNYAASSTLANQIRLGAPADVFLSAHVRWMDELEQHGDIDPDSRRDLFTNGLVVIMPAGARPNSALAAAYYLNVVLTINMKEPVSEPPVVRTPAALWLGIAASVAGVVYLGVFPSRILELVQGLLL